MSPRRMVAIVLALVALSTLLTPFRRDLFVGDETKYAQVIREMRATGAFFLPTLGGQPFTHKPPLHFWLIDLLTLPFGVYSMWAFVLPSLAAFALLLWLMWRSGGTMAAFVCATSLLLWASAQTARMDVSFTLFIAAGLILMERFFDGDDFRALLGCAVALGIATLIKGPMAPIIGITLFLLEWWRRRRVPRGNYLPAIAAMIVIPLAWFVPAMIVGGHAYTREVIVKQTVGRAVATWVHQAPPWFYLEHLPATLFPWFFLAVVAAIALRRKRQFWINWILAVLLPYSLLSSKLDVYMMALIPPVALLIADLLECGGRAAALQKVGDQEGYGRDQGHHVDVELRAQQRIRQEDSEDPVDPELPLASQRDRGDDGEEEPGEERGRQVLEVEPRRRLVDPRGHGAADGLLDDDLARVGVAADDHGRDEPRQRNDDHRRDGGEIVPARDAPPPPPLQQEKRDADDRGHRSLDQRGDAEGDGAAEERAKVVA